MVVIRIEKRTDSVEEAVRRAAAPWQMERIPEEGGGFRLMPPLLYGIHGIGCEERDGKWCFWREAMATTWEDFLLMHLTHTAAADLGSLLAYVQADGSMRLVEPTPEAFASFDAYADYVVRNEQGIVRDMKRNWIYTHRTRYVR